MTAAKAGVAASLVPAGPQDLDIVHELRRRGTTELAKLGFDEWARRGAPGLTEQDFDAGRLHVVTEGAAVVGSVVLARGGDPALWTDEELAEPALYLDRLVIGHRLASAPLAGEVLGLVREAAAREGLRSLRTDVWADHEVLLRSCRRLGFAPVRTIDHPAAGELLLLQAPVED